MGRVVCFDVDLTLVWTGGAGVAALERAFLERLGIERSMDGVACDGMTDPAIVRLVLTRRGLCTPDNLQRILEAYVAHLPALVEQAQGYRVLPGVIETLEYLAGRDGVICALATGNVERGARVKLEGARLNRYFPVGGFGSDAEDRGELVRVGIRRARERLGDPAAAAVVVGDTPRDVAAAHDAAALAVGVATGRYDVAALGASGADLVLPDLTGPRQWLAQVERLLR